jgi:hypothetical protein
MTAPFVSQLRVRPDSVRLGTDDEPVITLRVQVAETWDTMRIDAPAETPVSAIKQRALEVLVPDAQHSVDYVTKLHGWEVLDEGVSAAAAGAVSGSTFLLHLRRRRPVR